MTRLETIRKNDETVRSPIVKKDFQKILKQSTQIAFHPLSHILVQWRKVRIHLTISMILLRQYSVKIGSRLTGLGVPCELT